MELLHNSFSWDRANLHTHTRRCKHATGEDREYVEAAIKAGYKVLGFSDHAPYLFPNDYISPTRMNICDLEHYVKSIQLLKEEYQQDITIYCGLEMEYFPELFTETIAKISEYDLDYLLLGQHYFDNEIGYVHVGREWIEESYLERYIQRVREALDTGLFMGVAHPDIINYVGEKSCYLKHMQALADELKERNMPIEVNLNGLRDGIHYPNIDFIDLCIQNENDFVIGVDAHEPQELLDFKTYERAVCMIESRGGKIKNKLNRH